MPICQDCQSVIPFEDEMPEIGTLVICPACGAEHEVISQDPLELAMIEEEK